MNDLKTAYGTRAGARTSEYPYGSFLNAIAKGTGTPYDAKFQGDLNALMQSIVVATGISPNDVTDTVLSSQLFNGLRSVAAQGSVGYNWVKASGADLTAGFFAEGGGLIVGAEFSARATTEPVSVSADGGFTWAGSSPVGMSTDEGRGLAYGDGKFVIITGVAATPGSAWTSTDGITWVEQTGLQDNKEWKDLIFDGTNFIALSTTTVSISSDGIGWTEIAIPATQVWQSLATSGAITVAVASGGTGSRTMRTTDSGVSWAAVGSDDDTQAWYDVTYGNGVFVAVSGAGKATHSTDLGVTWASVQTPATDSFTSIVYAGGRFVIRSVVGGLLISPEGTKWGEVISSPFSSGGGMFNTSEGYLVTWYLDTPYLSGV